MNADPFHVVRPESSERLVCSVELPVDQQTAFAYHERRGALARLIPPWESVQVESSDGSLQSGSQVVLKLLTAGVPLRWHARHTEYDPPRRFADLQEKGPFRFFHHRHEFTRLGPDTSRLTDDVAYILPGGPLGSVLGGGLARQKIESMFAYRHRVTRDDLQLLRRYSREPLRVAVSGSSGMVGSALCNLLSLLGHHVKTISRGQSGDQDTIAAWGKPDELEKFNEIDVVVHLAGKSIASSRWSENVKREIRDSRVQKTTQLARGLASLSDPPSTFVCASATGIYGDRGDEVLSEDSATSDGFLPEVAAEWEASCQPARDAGIRVVNTRFGMVLSPQGGALEKSLTPAKFFGGCLGNGNQYWSWIGLDDCISAIYHVMRTPGLSGPVNFVAPESLTNREFADVLARVLNRAALLPAPATMLRLALGEMADDLLLSSQRVTPTKLTESGYEFRFSTLEPLLKYCLGKNRLAMEQQS